MPDETFVTGNPKVRIFGCIKVDKESFMNKTFGSPSKNTNKPSSPFKNKRGRMGNLDIGKIPSEDKNSFPADVELTDSQRSKRAQANWNKLKTHISAMRLRANFLVTFLDEENEMK